MYELDNSVINGIGEHAPVARPSNIAISAYPNPFNSSVTIAVEQTFLSVQNGQTGMSDLPIAIEIFDINGRIVEEIPANNPVGDGSPVPSSNGRGDRAPTEIVWTPDKSLGSGVYLVRVKSGDENITKRVVYLK